MSTSPARIRALYRAFLREMPPRPVLASPRSPLHVQLRTAFESPSTSSSSPSPSSALPPPAHTDHYLAYLQSQRLYATLLERYNPGMAGNMDEEERVRLSARRVGMNLPKQFDAEKQ